MTARPTPDLLARCLGSAWGIDTSSLWTPENPASGQCGVTALVVQDLAGGEILKTAVSGAIHFYNRIDGIRHDFTADQFAIPIAYDDLPASRQEAMDDTSEPQYAALSARMRIVPRPSARLVVLDPEGRVLLFHFVHKESPLAGTSFWATPGGALDAGESYEQAARRELFEETGLSVAVGQELAVRHTVFMMPQGGMVDAEERYFAVRSDGMADHRANPDPVERDLIATARWWSGAELEAACETIYPETIASLRIKASEVV